MKEIIISTLVALALMTSTTAGAVTLQEVCSAQGKIGAMTYNQFTKEGMTLSELMNSVDADMSDHTRTLIAMVWDLRDAIESPEQAYETAYSFCMQTM